MNGPTVSSLCLVVTDTCFLASEWAGFWQIAGIAITSVFGAVGVWKIILELRRANEQREKESEDKAVSARLKRTEFFLSQHRRLFDDKDLADVMRNVHLDKPVLREEFMWEKNRKFLTFIEEIALLVNANQIDKEVAYYMFGYYARRARDGKNFNFGINPSEEHWRLFYKFCDESAKFSDRFPREPGLIPAL